MGVEFQKVNANGQLGNIPANAAMQQQISDLRLSIAGEGLKITGEAMAVPALTAGAVAAGAPVETLALPAFLAGKTIPNLGSYRSAKTIIQKFAYMNPDLNPQDGIIPQSNEEATTRRLEEMREVMVFMEKTLRVQIPKEWKEEWQMMRDPEKRKTIIGSNLTEAALAFYLVARVQTSLNVMQRNVDMGTHVRDAIAVLGLFVGEFLVRGFCTWGFQEGMIKALSRDGEYYYSTKEDKTRVTGFDNTDKYGIRADKSPSRYTLAHVGYAYTEENQVHRNFWSAFLFETWDRDVYFNINAGLNNKMVDKEYRKFRDDILKFSEGLRSITLSAYAKHKKDVAAGAYSPTTEAARLKKALGQIRDAYLGQSKKFREAGGKTLKNREQDNGGMLDIYLADQFEAHAKMWQKRIEEVDEQVAAGTFDAKRAEEYYVYLKNKFTFDLVINLRGWENHISLEFFNGRLADIKNRLNPGTLSAPLDEYKARWIIEELKKSLEAADAKMSDKTEKKLGTMVLKGVADKMTGEEFLKMVLMEAVSQVPYEGGEKAGGQNYLFDKMGKTYVVAGTAAGTRLQFTKEEWLAGGSDLILTAEERNKIGLLSHNVFMLVRGNFDHATKVNEVFLPKNDPSDPDVLDQEKIDEIVQKAISEAKITDREKLRIIERLVRSYMKDGNTVGELVNEILKIGVHNGEITWEVFKKPDFLASFDKDYVRRSINPHTLQFEDIFRFDIPVYERLMAEGKVNFTMVQNQQNYAYMLKRGVDDKGKPIMLDHDLEATAQSAAMDQNLWYGALVQMVDNANLMLGKSMAAGATVGDFIDDCVNTFLGPRATEEVRKKLSDAVKVEMGGMLGHKIDRALGAEVIERLKSHAEFAASLSATGLLPGRDVRNHSGFNCGTDRMEHLKEIIAYNDQYTLDRNGRVMSQTLVKFNTVTQKMDMFAYMPRYSQKGPAGTAAKASENKEICQGHMLTNDEKMRINAEYAAQGYTVEFAKKEIDYYRGTKEIPGTKGRTITGGKKAPRIFHDHILVKDSLGRVVKDIFYYYPGVEKDGATVSENLKDINKARKVEIEYIYNGKNKDHSSKVIKDHSTATAVTDAAGTTTYVRKEYVESRLVEGRKIRDLARCREDQLDLILSNYREIAEVDSWKTLERLPNGEIVVEITLNAPQIESRRIAADGSYVERLQTPLCIIYDKAITEDMGTTYQQEKSAFEMMIVPTDVGRGMGPAQGTSLVKQHFRWTDGIRCYLHNKPFYEQHPSLSPRKKWEKLQAFAWYQHALTDILLTGVPIYYWATTLTTSDSAIPLKPDDMFYLVWFGGMSVATLANYFRHQSLVDQDSTTRGEQVRATWNKETLIRITGPAYIHGAMSSYNDSAKDFNITESGGRQMMPYGYLRSNQWARGLSMAPAIVGGGFIAYQAYTAGTDASVAKYLGWLLASGFPVLNYAQYNSGMSTHYAWWTSFKDYTNAIIFVNGGKDIKMYKSNIDLAFDVEDTDTVTFTFRADEKELNAIRTGLEAFADILVMKRMDSGKIMVKLSIKKDGMFDPENPAERAYVDGMFWSRHDLQYYDRLYGAANASRRYSWGADKLLPDPELVDPLLATDAVGTTYQMLRTTKNYYLGLGSLHRKALALAESSLSNLEQVLMEARMSKPLLETANKSELNKVLGAKRTNALLASNARNAQNLINIINDKRSTEGDVRAAVIFLTRLLTLTENSADAIELAARMLMTKRANESDNDLMARQTGEETLKMGRKAVSLDAIYNAIRRSGDVNSTAAFKDSLENFIVEAFKLTPNDKDGKPTPKVTMLLELIKNGQLDLVSRIIRKQNNGEILAILKATATVQDEIKILDELSKVSRSSMTLADEMVKANYGVDLKTLKAYVDGTIRDPLAIAMSLREYGKTLKNEQMNWLALRVFGPDRMGAIIEADAQRARDTKVAKPVPPIKIRVLIR